MRVAVLLPGAGTRPGGRPPFLPRGKKGGKETRPAVCDPHAARGGTPGARRWRGALRNSLRAARFAQTAAASQFTKHARLRACHPTTASPQAQPERGWRRHEPSLRSAWRARRAAPAPLGAERSDGLWGSWAAALPSGCAEERSGQRIRARDCLSAAGASSSETPLAASTAGCPQRSGGTRPAGSPFLCLLSFGEAKESESPAGARPGHQLTQKAQRSLRQKASHQALQMRPQRLQVHKAQVIHRR